MNKSEIKKQLSKATHINASDTFLSDPKNLESIAKMVEIASKKRFKKLKTF